MANTTTTPQVIEVGDTVRLIGRKGKGIVEAVAGNRIEISYTWRVNRTDTGVSVRSYAADRVELVRKGSAEADAIAELDAILDKRDAERAAARGETLEQYRTREAAEAAARVAAMVASSAAATAAREARHAAAEAAEAAAVVAAAKREADDRAEMERAAVEFPKHLALHGGDFFDALLCGVDAECPLAG